MPQLDGEDERQLMLELDRCCYFLFFYFLFFLNNIDLQCVGGKKCLHYNSIAEVLGIIKTIRPVCGTPQGGVLSSRIWNLAFDPLLKLLNDNSPCSPVGFADDGALCFMGIDPDTMVANAQKQLNLAIDWGAQNGLSFCPKKNHWSFLPESITFTKKFYQR